MKERQDSDQTSHLVSVIVPIYAVEAYLSSCVESLLAQTYPDLEILLVNDGSPDASGNICESFAARDARVRVINKPNGGLSSARNAGIEVARGEYLCFVDGDDWVEPSYVEELLCAAEESDSQVAVCGYRRVSHTSSELRGFRREGTISSHAAVRGLYGDDYLILTVAWNKIFHKTLFMTRRFREGLIHEDEQIIASLYLASSRVNCFSKPLYHYREREESITGVQVEKISLDKVVAYEDRLAMLRAHGSGEFVVGLTLRRLVTIVLTLLASGATGKRRYANGVTETDLLRRLRLYSPLVRPRIHPVALWGRFFLIAPALGARVYSWRCDLRVWVRDVVRPRRRVGSANA